MTDTPGAKFVDGLRVTAAHLNHMQSVAGAVYHNGHGLEQQLNVGGQ